MIRLFAFLAALLAAVAFARPSTPVDDGAVPESAPLSPFDATHAAVTKLDPPLLQAIRRAARDARRDGIDLRLTSGWRSARHQQQLLDAAIKTYGSEETARRYVSTPEKSAHVSGKAVDVGPTAAAYWVIQHGSEYGLCQTYANEIWHFELSAGRCPTPLPDASSG
jgi:D-alanyl-D-alanine carboxypeptidase